MSYVLKTNNLTKVFNGKEVVSNVNMSIKKGKIYGFLGPNGAGKTTIMKLITNLLKPTSGDIEIFGQKLTIKSYELLKRIGTLIEYPVFYDKLTARANLELHCEYMGYHNNNAIDEALSLVNLTNINNNTVNEFSMGMKQRLAIARAIITKPEFLILDEPINGLDPIGIKEMRDLFIMLCEEYGISILISSHILNEIEHIADTIGVINNGIIKKEVSMDTIRNNNTKYIEIITPDCNKALYVLDNKIQLTNFKTLDNKTIRIYDTNITQNEITKALILHNITIESINKKQSSLEEYFLDIINGGIINE